MTDTDCSNPQTRRVIFRRKEQGQWRKTPQWKKTVEDHAHVPEAVCIHCNRKHGQVMIDQNGEAKFNKKGDEKKVYLTINHTSRIPYNDFILYTTWDPKWMEICCLACNWAYEKGMKPCPECLKIGVVRYIKWYEPECFSCYLKKNPEVLKRIEETRVQQATASRDHKAAQSEKRRRAKVKHPCTFHGIGQKCRKGGACEYSPTKAPKNCTRGFQAKKKLGTKP
jgi:hypothetical protein